MLDFIKTFGLTEKGNQAEGACIKYIEQVASQGIEAFKKVFKTLPASSQKEMGEIFIRKVLCSYAKSSILEPVREITCFFVKECGAEINVYDKDGKTPLYIAVRNTNMDRIRFIVEECDGNVNFPDKDGSTPVHIAAYSVEWWSNWEKESTMKAILSQHIEILNYFIENGADLEDLAKKHPRSKPFIKDHFAKIAKTQESLKPFLLSDVINIVTGHMTGKDPVKKQAQPTPQYIPHFRARHQGRDRALPYGINPRNATHDLGRFTNEHGCKRSCRLLGKRKSP